ncbi:integrase [Aquamicrobium sp.]|uniref:integrase n=1 Tax=Aquamicrobium sp. TaxID=1872579 RepID=UPI002583EADA|nr:integrase [Aquamicrobium sp.]MCK9549535.1 integrase [Aquamicrobium sp.]
MTTPAHARAPAFDDRPVLASAPLKAGHAREELSRVGDPSWDLGPAVFRENARRHHAIVHFDALEHADMQAAMRAYLYAHLNVHLPGYSQKLPPTCIRQAFNRARRFFVFVRLNLGRLDLACIDQALVDAYVRHLRDDLALRPEVAAQHLQLVSHLYHYRDYFPDGGLVFEPWAGRAPGRVAGHRHIVENRTPRFPEEVIAALLAWSLRYVTVFAHDILAARDALDRLEARRARLLSIERRLPDTERRLRQRARLERHLDHRARQGRGVPIWTSLRTNPGALEATRTINYHLLHLHAGVDALAEPAMSFRSSKSGYALIKAAVANLGVEVGGMDTPISIDPDSGQPWRARFDVKTLMHEEQMLQAAAYIVCAYLTGMRDCEVQAMRRGSLSIARSEDGLVERLRIRSTIYKGRAAMGEAASWVTIEPVAEAVAVLERLSARPARSSGADTLWPALHSSSGKTHLSGDVGRHLNAFRDHLNTAFGSADTPVIPPGPDGKPWRITTRQFRRTIAWHIANRPFGTIAGMIQYKHASVAAFEGYAGTSSSGFRAEVETQRRLGQLDDLLDYFDRRQGGGSLGGPAGPRIARTLDDTAERLGPLPAMVADRARLRVMLASVARTLHVGQLADCFFDPATALCLRRVTAPDPRQPLTALCEPTRCPNACITERHRPVWERAAADAKAHLRERRISDLQRQALESELDRLTTVIAGIDPPAP